MILGVCIVQVWSISGGATISPKREAAAASGSTYTGFASSNAAAQCRIIGWFTGSGDTVRAGRSDRLAHQRGEPLVEGLLGHAACYHGPPDGLQTRGRTRRVRRRADQPASDSIICDVHHVGVLIGLQRAGVPPGICTKYGEPNSVCARPGTTKSLLTHVEPLANAASRDVVSLARASTVSASARVRTM